jgi:hypothetical protein
MTTWMDSVNDKLDEYVSMNDNLIDMSLNDKLDDMSMNDNLSDMSL